MINANGFTLIELIVIIVILGALTAIGMKSLTYGIQEARTQETKQELQSISYAISGNPNLYNNNFRTDFGYVGDVGSLPVNLDALAANPGGYSTWKGPYIKSAFSNYAADFKTDAWGKNYLYSGGNSIKSVGLVTDTITQILSASASDLTTNSVTGKVLDAAGNAPGGSAGNISVHLTYPNGSGSTRDSVLSPSSTGDFSFTGFVPIGNRSISAVYATTSDTVQSYVSVLPKSTAVANLHFPKSLWGGSGSLPTNLQVVPGSTFITGGHNEEINVSIENPSSSGKTITWVKITFTPVAYYNKLKWGNTTLFSDNTPRTASGATVTFSSSQYLQGYGKTVDLYIHDFRSTPSGSSSYIDMSNQQITLEFSDGSLVIFNSGT